jgi:predicted Fe-S protein YdhL (DUF1289 family)
MQRQVSLDFRRDNLAVLWQRLPEGERRAVIEQMARLIARAAQARSKKEQKKEGSRP